MTKTEIRKRMEMLRSSLTHDDVVSRSMAIEKSLTSLKAYEKAAVVFTYASFRNEVSTNTIIQKALNCGKRVAVPVCITKDKVLLPCEIESLDDLVPGTWGIPEPKEGKHKVIECSEIDLAVVPGLSFDRQFNRLGYGAGYYDRFLPALRKDAIKIGICYDFQLIEQLPSEPFDIPMDGVITESTVLIRPGIK
ncbi:MAG TPA: 5-formyltetrahydrofolate cyclo-ligase [Clostridiales bacterium]|nr:5-formyltetrahydrofolate cyclo-ligase [Clostridiales bacterium]